MKKKAKQKSEVQLYSQGTIQQDNKMLSSFQQMQVKNELAEVLKELFRDENLLMITDLSSDEIKLVTRIRMIAKMKDIKYWNEGLDYYMKLVLSRDRKSRKEMLDAIKGYTQSKNMLQKLNPANWGK